MGKNLREGVIEGVSEMEGETEIDIDEDEVNDSETDADALKLSSESSSKVASRSSCEQILKNVFCEKVE
jgi:hypothetical protein